MIDGPAATSIREAIEGGQTALGIEFGSTRIKAVLIGPDNQPVATGWLSGPMSTALILVEPNSIPRAVWPPSIASRMLVAAGPSIIVDPPCGGSVRRSLPHRTSERRHHCSPVCALTTPRPQ